MSAIEQASVQFSPANLAAINIALGFLMFAVSLYIEPADLAALRRQPRAVATGLFAQWIYMPLLAVLIVVVFEPHPGIALGLLLVAACPGGNVSNYLTMLARGNVVLGICLTTLSTLAAAIAIPLIFSATASIVPGREQLPALTVNPVEMIGSVLLLIALPLALGGWLKWQRPDWALRIRKPIRTLAGLMLLVLILGGLVSHLSLARVVVGELFIWVFLLNALSTAGGYGLAWLTRLDEPDRRAIALESGIQNSGLGLVLIFNFFDGYAPMALVAAWWGLWHIIAGSVIAGVWSRLPPRS